MKSPTQQLAWLQLGINHIPGGILALVKLCQFWKYVQVKHAQLLLCDARLLRGVLGHSKRRCCSDAERVNALGLGLTST